jgi:hypothetical protein
MVFKNNKINKLLFLIYLMLLDCVVFAQGGFPGDEDNNGDLEGTDSPINKHIVFLFIIGVLYAFYFLKIKIKKDNDSYLY